MEPRTVEFEPGEVIADTYRIVRRIAAGGFGVVYEARHVRLAERRVAIKILTAERADSDEFLPRFRREAEIGASLDHPHIVTVSDWNTLPNGLPYFVMEYLEGENLAQRMRRGQIPDEEIFHIVESICAALQAAHNRGIVHRDLKPGNIFLCQPAAGARFPFVKVLDFGISKVTRQETLQTSGLKLLGTPRYLAPEQAKADTLRISARTDQFQLASITYEMFAGRTPFVGDTLESIVYNVVHAPPIPLKEIRPDVPDAVVSGLSRALEKNPSRRFDTVTDFYKALRGELDEAEATGELDPTVPLTPGVPGSEKPEDLSLSTRPPSRAPWWMWVIGAVALTALVAILGTQDFGNTASTPLPTISGSKKPTGTTAMPVTSAPVESPTPSATAETQSTASSTPTPVPSTPAATPTPAEGARVKAKLDHVEELYRQGDYAEALRQAKQAVAIQDVPRAHRLIVLSHCHRMDLGNAKAWFHYVAIQDREQVREKCSELGIEL